jgi:hypothetical protein
MKTIIAGTRTINSYELVRVAIHSSKFKITEVVSGGCYGVDTIGEEWARENNIPVKVFPADWNKYGKSAGPRRNEQMANYADALILIWDGDSRGSRSMLNLAYERNLAVYQYVTNVTRKL